MKTTLITDIISLFAKAETDLAKAKATLSTILTFCTNLLSGIQAFITSGTIPEVIVTDLPKWAISIISMLPGLLQLIPNEADIAAFLNDIISSINSELQIIEAKISESAASAGNTAGTKTQPIALASVTALTQKMNNGKTIVDAIPNTAHPNVALVKKVFNDAQALIKGIIPELEALFAKA